MSDHEVEDDDQEEEEDEEEEVSACLGPLESGSQLYKSLSMGLRENMW